ncbi:MAG: hypothetical protein KQI35_02955 [Bacteroidetes bacterium]|nr:hypothetical protein [Bacteroidota bacterium]
MRRQYIIILFILLQTMAFGRAKFADGYIITHQGDTIYGKIKIKVDKNEKLIPSKMQEKITFNNREGQRSVYEAGTIRSFYFFYDFETPTFVSVPFFKESNLFLKVIGEQGYLKLYQYYPIDEKGLSNAYELAEYVYGVFDFGERYFFYILKPDGDRLLMGKHTPKNKILEFFKEDTALAQKIDTREYGYADVYRMVREYNQWKAEISGSNNLDSTEESIPE